MSIKIFALACTLNTCCVFAGYASPQVWLAGVDPIVSATVDTRPDPDYMELFQPDAPWDKAAQVVQVFKTSTQFLARASDATLSHLFADLKRRNIALAVEALMLTASAKCGTGIEGYSAPETMEMVAARVQRLGGDLRYVAMDEPLGFGHFSHLPNACQASLADLANDVAGKVRAIRRTFPAVLIGDIEGFSHPAPQEDVDAMMEWTRAYEAAVGTRLSFLHVDMLWGGNWQPQVKQLAGRLHAAGIQLGIIYNGSPDDQTGVSWTRNAEQHFAAVEADPGLVPDQAILQTWMRQPDHMLPETEPGTMTWLVNRYRAAQTQLIVQRDGMTVQGELKDTAGRPLADAAVNLAAEVPGHSNAPVLHTLSGRVPPKAVAATLGIRINAECNCSGLADISIGPVRFHNIHTGETHQQNLQSPTTADDATTPAHFQAKPGQSISQNTQHFPVTANDPFTLQVPMHAELTSAGSGYLAVIFLDASGKEIQRIRMLFQPVEVPIAKITTDAQGRFSLLPNPVTLRASVGFHAEFMGDPQHRMSSMIVH